MPIARIKNPYARRALLLLTLPVVPLVFVIELLFIFLDGFIEVVSDVASAFRGAWRGM